MPLSPPLFAIFTSLIEERVGLHYRPADSELLADRLETRALEAGFGSLLDYYYFLRYDDPDGTEFDALVDALVVNETYFFREHDQLKVMVDEFLAPIFARGGSARIWSAACSTGEEPLTVAMLLAERGWLGRSEIVATDVSRKALATARSGSYPLRSSQRAPVPSLAARFLHPENGRVQVDPQLTDAVKWRRLNLTDAEALKTLGRFDVILCRNVLIYFDDHVVRTLGERMIEALNPKGVLFVGVSESLLRLGLPLACIERGGVFVYQRTT